MSNKKQTAKVVIKFNNGEKVEIATLDEGADFSLQLKQPELEQTEPNPPSDLTLEGKVTNPSVTFTSPEGETFEISVELI